MKRKFKKMLTHIFNPSQNWIYCVIVIPKLQRKNKGIKNFTILLLPIIAFLFKKSELKK